MRDFYFRDSTDINHRPDTFEISDDMEELVYQIKMLLLTNKGEVLGEPRFGASLDLLLFDTQFNPEAVSQLVLRQINLFCEIARGFNLGVRITKVEDGKFREAVILDINVEGKSIFGFIL